MNKKNIPKGYEPCLNEESTHYLLATGDLIPEKRAYNSVHIFASIINPLDLSSLGITPVRKVERKPIEITFGGLGIHFNDRPSSWELDVPTEFIGKTFREVDPNP